MKSAILSDLHGYLATLAQLSPDGTQLQNGIGFSGATIGPGLAILRRFPYWDARDCQKAHEIAIVHSKQLGINREVLAADWAAFAPSLDAELAALAAEARAMAAEEIETASTSDQPFGVAFGEWKDIETKAGKAKRVRSGEPTQAFWAAYKAGKEQIRDAGFSISKFGGNWQVAQWQDVGEAAPAKELIPVSPLVDASNLLPYQPAAAAINVCAIRNFGAAVDRSDTGTGKTYVNLAAMRELGISPVVICPKAVIPSWKRAAELLGVDIRVVNYEAIKTGKGPLGTWDKAVLPWKGEKGETLHEDVFAFAQDVKGLIFDEAHRAKGTDSANALLMRAAAEQQIPTIAASATLAHSPLEMRAVCALLGFAKWHRFWKWTLRNGCQKSRWGGFEFDGSKYVMDRLHDQLVNRGARVRVADLGDMFPETQIKAEAYNLNGMAAKIDEIDAEMHREIAALEARSAKDKTNNRAAILVAMLRARQRAELVKVPLFVELAQDAYAEGQSVTVFVNFRETLDAIVSRLETAKIGQIETIKGNQGDADREAGIARFQADQSRVIVAMIQAGGVGISLHDLNGQYPRFSIVSPTWSAVQLRQVFGRIHRAGGKTKSVQRVVFVADSVEEKVRRAVADKLDRLDTLNDGDLGRTVPDQVADCVL